MSVIVRLFLQKAFFTFLIIISLSSFLLAMDEDECNQKEKGRAVVQFVNNEPSKDVFQQSPPSSLWGKSSQWVWNNGGIWVDRFTIGATTLGGHYIGSIYENTISAYVANTMGASPVSMSHNMQQLESMEWEDTIRNRRIALRAGTYQYPYPYNCIGEVVGTAAGYTLGVGITKTRQWGMDKLIQCYRPVKNWYISLLSSLGWKLVTKAQDLKDE
jgi:hypothetical protein